MKSLHVSPFLLALLPLALLSSPTSAAVVTLDASSGAVYDAIVDGFPGVYTRNGSPDATGNALSVAVKSGVTEMRAIAEFPLAGLGSITSTDVVSATLELNIDDVIGSFGPGANFDGTAAEDIFLWAWNGNGSIDLTDFNNVAGPPSASVDTRSYGSITDSSLASTGPILMQIDLTAALKSRLDAAATHLGLTLATTDENTATSLDNLGNGGAGPAGVNGSILPRLIVTIAEAEPPVFGTSERACQKELATQTQKLSGLTHKLLNNCFHRLLKATAAGDDTADAAAYCIELLNPSSSESSLSRARAKSALKIDNKCGGLLPAALNSPCDDAAVSFDTVAACLASEVTESVSATVRASFADACALLNAAGLADDFPTICAAN